MQPSQLPVVQGGPSKGEVTLREIQQQNHVAGRRCGECTACCTFMVVKELNKPAKVACPHCTTAGCGVYESRPPTCREWACEWWLGRLGLTDAQRPDKLGLMFSYHPAIMVVNECWPGAAMTKAALRLLNRMKSRLPLLFVPANGTAFCLGPRDAREEIEAAGFGVDADEKLLGDPTNRHASKFRPPQ